VLLLLLLLFTTPLAASCHVSMRSLLATLLHLATNSSMHTQQLHTNCACCIAGVRYNCSQRLALTNKLCCTPPILCCVHTAIQSEEDRLEHEFESCPRRLVSCPWAGCEAAVRAAKLRAHRARHVLVQGIIDFNAAGVHSFTVPDNCHKMKVYACCLLLLVLLLCCPVSCCCL
jgi:hypothetical protein